MIAIVAILGLSACDTQVVESGLATTLSVQSAQVDLPQEDLGQLALNGVSFAGNFIAQTEAAVLGQGVNANRPTRAVIDLDRVTISIVSGSRASGSYTLVDIATGGVLFGPQDFSVQTPSATSQAGGGLIGLALGAAIGGAAQQNEGPFSREVEELGQLVGNRISSQIFGSSF